MLNIGNSQVQNNSWQWNAVFLSILSSGDFTQLPFWVDFLLHRCTRCTRFTLELPATSDAFARLRACWAQSRKAPASPSCWPKWCLKIYFGVTDLEGRWGEMDKTLQEWKCRALKSWCLQLHTSSCFDRFPQISACHFLSLRNLFLILRCLQKSVDCRQMALDLRSQSFMAMLELPPKRPS